MESSSPVAPRRAPRKVVPLQLTTNQDSNTRKCHSLITPPASVVSATITTRTHTGGRLSPAQIASFKTKIKTYSTDTNAAYTRSRAFLSFLNSIESPLRNDPLQIPRTSCGIDEKENLKIPVHVNVRKRGSFEIPNAMPLSPTSLIFECGMTIEHPRLVTEGSNLDMDLEPPSSSSLIFTVEVNFLDGTADIIPLSPIPPEVDNSCVGEEEGVEDGGTTPTASSSKRTGSHRQNRSGGWYMKSPETGLFAAIGA